MLQRFICNIYLFGQFIIDSTIDSPQCELIEKLNPFESITFHREFTVAQFSEVGVNVVVNIEKRQHQQLYSLHEVTGFHKYVFNFY